MAKIPTTGSRDRSALRPTRTPGPTPRVRSRRQPIGAVIELTVREIRVFEPDRDFVGRPRAWPSNRSWIISGGIGESIVFDAPVPQFLGLHSIGRPYLTSRDQNHRTQSQMPSDRFSLSTCRREYSKRIKSIGNHCDAIIRFLSDHSFIFANSRIYKYSETNNDLVCSIPLPELIH